MLLPLIDNLFILITYLLAAVCLNLNKMVVCQKKKIICNSVHVSY